MTTKSPIVQAPAMVKVSRDVVKVQRAGSQCGAGNPANASEKAWFTELAQSRGQIVQDHGDYLTFHTPMEVAIPKQNIQSGEVFLAKDGKSISATPIVENVLLEIERSAALPTDVVVK